jgi:hypothetical protein
MRKAAEILVLPAAAWVFFLIADQLMRLIVTTTVNIFGLP